MPKNFYVGIRSVFAVLLIAFFVFSDKPSIDAKLMQVNIQTFFLFKSVMLIVVYGLFIVALVLVARSSSRIFRFAVLVLVSISSLYVDVFYYASGKVMEYIDFVILYQSKANVFDALKMYNSEIMAAFPRLCVLWIGFIIMPKGLKHTQKNMRFFMTAGGGYILLLLLVVFVMLTCIYRQGAATNKLPSPLSPLALLLAYVYDNAFSTHPSYNYTTLQMPSNSRKISHIVLIVDESVRADYSSFKRLSNIPESWHIIDYGTANSAANCSHISNIILRKGVRSGRVTQDFYENPLIWSYAINAGYETYLYDAQMGGNGHDFFDASELRLIRYNLSQTNIDKDADILESLTYLNDETPSFTYIIKKGSHFPYSAPKEIVAEPQDSYTKDNQERVMYLRNVICQSDMFFETLFKNQYKQGVLFIYTSDHGQNLQDVAGLTHCSSTNPYFGEGEVPLVIMSNRELDGLQAYADSNLNRASHFHIIPTILMYMGYDIENLGYAKETSLFYKVDSVDGFFYGVPFGFFGREPDFAVRE